MKTLRPAVTAVMLVFFLWPVVGKAAAPPKLSAAYEWLDISLEATAREVDRHGARPTIISRPLAIALTAMYDAWVAYDEKAVGTRLGRTLRRPASERTLANKEKAIAYAAYRALIDVYPEDKAWIDEQMRGKGFNPDDASTDPSTPQGVGNIAARAVCAYRHHDGANQFGDKVGSNGVPCSDYAYYEPVNTLLVDGATGSEWDFAGRAIRGPLTGRQVAKIELLRDYWFAWRAYHPDTAIYSAGLTRQRS